MPLASLLPLGIITAAIGVGGTLLGLVPYLTRSEVSIIVRTVAPRDVISTLLATSEDMPAHMLSDVHLAISHAVLSARVSHARKQSHPCNLQNSQPLCMPRVCVACLPAPLLAG